MTHKGEGPVRRSSTHPVPGVEKKKKKGFVFFLATRVEEKKRKKTRPSFNISRKWKKKKEGQSTNSPPSSLFQRPKAEKGWFSPIRKGSKLCSVFSHRALWHRKKKKEKDITAVPLRRGLGGEKRKPRHDLACAIHRPSWSPGRGKKRKEKKGGQVVGHCPLSGLGKEERGGEAHRFGQPSSTPQAHDAGKRKKGEIRACGSRS